MEKRKEEMESEMDKCLLRCLEGKASKAEYEQAFRWAQESENKRHYRELLDALAASYLIQPSDRTEQKQVWDGIRHKMSDGRKRTSVFTTVSRWMTAAVVMIFLLSGVYFVHNKKQQTDVSPYTVETVKNGKSVLHLNDGTKIWLNRNSHIACDKNFGKKDRHVELVGEAYFEIAKDADKPFTVKTEGLDVEALGTRFNLDAPSEKQTVTVTLTEGKVMAKTVERQLILNPGQQLKMDRTNRELSVSDVDCDMFTSWKNDEIIFKQESLERIFRLMEDNFNVKIYLENPQISQRKVTGRFPLDEKPDEMLKILQKHADFNYCYANDTIIIK